MRINVLVLFKKKSISKKSLSILKTVDDSFRFVNTLDDLSKSWVHLPQDYGNMLFRYLNFLTYKLKFHKKNQIIPPNLLIEDKDLNELASNDINN